MADYKDPENTILMELKDGTVVIELLPDVAPAHVERMKELARSGHYDNVCFHRVIVPAQKSARFCGGRRGRSPIEDLESRLRGDTILVLSVTSTSCLLASSAAIGNDPTPADADRSNRIRPI